MYILISIVPLLGAVLIVPLWSEPIPLRLENNLPLIEVRMNGASPFLFLLDTGADGTMATSKVMEATGLMLSYRAELVGAAGKEIVGVASDAELQVGSFTMHGVDVLQPTLLATRRIYRHMQGVLGQTSSGE